jgi:hypothetical protein
MQDAAGHAVGEEQVAENMFAGVVDFAAGMVALEDGDSSSDAGYQATDEHEDGDDEVLGPRRDFSSSMASGTLCSDGSGLGSSDCGFGHRTVVSRLVQLAFYSDSWGDVFSFGRRRAISNRFQLAGVLV